MRISFPILIVIPAQAGIQGNHHAVALGPRFRGGDGKILEGR